MQRGGRGHLEGVMGYRAMRLRFLDIEPEEVFEQAASGDQRCANFVKLWHRALAAATANSIHMAGPGKFLITGSRAGHVDVGWCGHSSSLDGMEATPNPIRPEPRMT